MLCGFLSLGSSLSLTNRGRIPLLENFHQRLSFGFRRPHAKGRHFGAAQSAHQSQEVVHAGHERIAEAQASGQRVDSALKVEPKRAEKWKGIFHFSKPKSCFILSSKNRLTKSGSEESEPSVPRFKRCECVHKYM